jgi:hypothetical protein
MGAGARLLFPAWSISLIATHPRHKAINQITGGYGDAIL